jgi:two-component system, chemotaxis family, protein-glutamate methylesterase/glutaminase
MQPSSGPSLRAAMTRPLDAARSTVAFVASAGGVSALGRILATLPRDLDAAVIVVVHLLPEHRSHLAEILARQTSLRVKTAQEGDELQAGWAYVAPPDVHLLVEAGGILSLQSGPPVHYVRPSGDVLLESLASNQDGNCLAVVLTGTGTDGAAGALAVKQSGGTVVAQDEETSEHFGMPSAAIAVGAVDFVLPLDEIARKVLDFVAP